MLNKIMKDLMNEVEEFCTKGNNKNLTNEQYGKVMEQHWDLVREEENRMRNAKGTIRTQHLKEGKEYRIEELQNETFRDILTNRNETFVSIIPSYKTKYEYTSYEFEKTSYETARFISRTKHS